MQLLLLSLCLGITIQETIAQVIPPIEYNFGTRSRIQKKIKQYTSIFVSSPVSNQMLGAVTGPYQPGPNVNTNRYFEFVNGAYQLITVVNAATTPMVPGRGYVIQRGGEGPPPIGIGPSTDCVQDYNAGGSTNTSDVNVTINGGVFNLIGNPYLGYLNVDAFLLDPANAGLVTGPVTIVGTQYDSLFRKST